MSVFIPSTHIHLSDAIMEAMRHWAPLEDAEKLTEAESDKLKSHRAALARISAMDEGNSQAAWIARHSGSGTLIPSKPMSSDKLERLTAAAAVTEEIAALANRSDSFESSKQAIWTRLRDRLFVHQIEGQLATLDGEISMPFPSSRWQRPAFQRVEQDGVVASTDTGQRLEAVCVISRLDLSRIIQLEVASSLHALTAAAENKCERWLEEEMRASPKEAIKPKEQYLVAAKSKFVGLSKRAFERSWSKAVATTGSRWGRPGKRAKPHS